MMQPLGNSAELQRLIELLDAGTIAPDGLHRLQGLLQTDFAARRFYRDYYDLRALLIWRLREPVDVATTQLDRPASDVEAPPGQPSANPQSASKPLPLSINRWLPSFLDGEFTVGSLVIFVVVAAVFGVVAYAWQQRTRHQDFLAAGDSTSQPAAEIGLLTMQEAGGLATPAAVRMGNRYQLSNGLANIVLARGTRIAIEGPAAWQFASDQRLELESGALAAHVPDQAVGFTVATPTVEIIDLGTDFSVVVRSEDEAKLSVTRGAVKVLVRNPALDELPARDTQPIRVGAGQALTISRSVAQGTVIRYAPPDTNWAPRLSQQIDEQQAQRTTVVAYQAFPNGARGNHFDFQGGVGFDFAVTRPIRVLRLGAFDHLGDGIDPESDLTVQLCSRDSQGTENADDDTAGTILAEAVISAKTAGPLNAGHRFVSLREPVVLAPGTYTILAYGFSERNPLFACIFPPSEKDGDLVGTPQCDVATSRYAIMPGRVRAEYRILPGTFPKALEPANMAHAAGTFEFEEQE